MSSVNRSGELESVSEMLEMIGASDEYTAALLVAAFARTFADTVQAIVWPYYGLDGDKSNMIEVDVWYRNDYEKLNDAGPVLSVKVHAKYKDLFEEPDAK